MAQRSFRSSVSKLAALAVFAASWQVAAPVLANQVIEEIVVTARKRSESAQDVPAAVAAFNSEELQERGVDNLIEVARLTPNITVNETNGLIAGAIQVFIRGIGNDPGFDQGVGVYVDDVYLNRTMGALLEVYDVERIEVLKGPQGHLYGRNTIGGAVKYVTREPGDELNAFGEIKAGTDSLRKLRAGLSGAIVEGRLYGSVAASATDMDGYQTNIFDGSEWASREEFAIRGSLIWQATDALQVKLTADHYSNDSNPYIPVRVAVNQAGPAGLGTFQALLSTANLFVPPGTPAAFLAPGETLDTRLYASEDVVNTAHVGPGGFDEYMIDATNFALTVDWDINDVWSLKSITAQRELDNNMPFDFDGSPQVFINTLQRRTQSDFSQEFQLNLTTDRVNGVLGFYYLDGEFGNKAETTQTPFLRLLTSHFKRTHKDDRTTKSSSLYFNVDWDISEQFQLSLGGRYTKDEKDVDQIADVTLTNHVAAFVNVPGLEQAPLVLSPLGAQIFAAHPLLNFFLPHFDLDGNFIGFGNMETTVTQPENKVGDDEWTEFTPSIRLRYQPNDDLMFYGGLSTGFKSGGFNVNGRALQALSYEPETVTTYVVGMKSTLAEGALRINVELFQNDYKDKQVDVIVLTGGSLVQTLDNVGEVESTGGEIEIMWLPPIDGLAFNLNVGVLDVEVEELIDQIPGTTMVGNVASQRELGYSPELTWQARVQYGFQLPNGSSITFAADASYRDEMWTDSPIDTTDTFLMNSFSEDRTLYNAFINWRSADEKWRVTFEGKNLTDERVLENTFNVSNFILGGYNRGRTYGVTIRYDHK